LVLSSLVENSDVLMTLSKEVTMFHGMTWLVLRVSIMTCIWLVLLVGASPHLLRYGGRLALKLSEGVAIGVLMLRIDLVIAESIYFRCSLRIDCKSWSKISCISFMRNIVKSVCYNLQ
jgi:hypothetical protein